MTSWLHSSPREIPLDADERNGKEHKKKADGESDHVAYKSCGSSAESVQNAAECGA